MSGEAGGRYRYPPGDLHVIYLPCRLADMRKTHSMVQVALALMADPDACHWGAETWKRSGIRSGVMYPILWRMLGQGWLTDGWEDAGHARAQKRPPRRYYKLTPAGKTELAALLAAARDDPRFRYLFPCDEES